MTFTDRIASIIHLRKFNFLIALFCASLIGAALYFQHVDNLDPCPLCIFQRVIVIAFGIVFLLKALHKPNPESIMQWVYFTLGLLVAAVGIGLAGRHVWLQSLPEHLVPACGPALDYLMEALPFLEVIEVVMQGSGECAKDDGWQFLWLNMPQWMLVIFCGFAVFCLLGLWMRWQQRKPF